MPRVQARSHAAPSTAWFPSTVGEVPAIATARPPQLISWGGYLRRALAAAICVARARDPPPSATSGGACPTWSRGTFTPGQSDRVAPNMRLRAAARGSAYRRAAAGAAVAARGGGVGGGGRLARRACSAAARRARLLAAAVGLAAAAAAAAPSSWSSWSSRTCCSRPSASRPSTLTDPRRLDRVRRWAKTVSAAAEAARRRRDFRRGSAGRGATRPRQVLARRDGERVAGGRPAARERAVSARCGGSTSWAPSPPPATALQCRQTLSGSRLRTTRRRHPRAHRRVLVLGAVAAR